MDNLYSFLLAAVAVYLMMFAGVAKRTLEWTRKPRICPTCGRARATCSCRSFLRSR